MELPLLKKGIKDLEKDMDDVELREWKESKKEDFMELLGDYGKKSEVWQIKTEEERDETHFGTLYIAIDDKDRVLESKKRKVGYRKIKYWFAFYKKPIKDLTKHGITVYCRRKMAQEPFFFLLQEGAASSGFPRSYITEK